MVGVPNPETTSLARAFVVLRPGHNASAQELEAHVSAQVPEHKDSCDTCVADAARVSLPSDVLDNITYVFWYP